MAENTHDLINRYIEDAIAAERNFESALHTFGKTGVQEPVKKMFLAASERQERNMSASRHC